jgi:N-methylhydantoinase B
MGGPVPGTENFAAREYFAEGLRVPPTRVWNRGQYLDDVVRLVVSNTRAPADAEGDLRAQAQATHVGERELGRLILKYGVDTVLQGFREVQDYTERLTRVRLAGLPDGTWSTEDYIDRDPDDNEGLIPICVEMTIAGDTVQYDLAGSHGTIGSAFNSCFGGSFSGIVGGMKMFYPDIPLNSGFYRPIELTLPDDSVVNTGPPVAASAFVMAYEKIMNCVIELWSRLIPERAMACSFNIEYLEVGGWDVRGRERRYFMWYDWMVGGWGARSDRDGASAYAAVFGAGLEAQPIEGQERLCPVVTTQHELLPDSGGPGRTRGGLGVVKGGRLTAADRTIMSYICDRERSITWGLWGGLPSNPMGVDFERAGERRYLGAAFAGERVLRGDVFSRPSAGGGGLGDPLDRDPVAVLNDVIDGYVTAARARIDYGVVIQVLDLEYGECLIDWEATVSERRRIRGERTSWLRTDPETVASQYRDGKLSRLDLVRQYGVILDWITGQLLPETTAVYRAMLARRVVPYWSEASMPAPAKKMRVSMTPARPQGA